MELTVASELSRRLDRLKVGLLREGLRIHPSAEAARRERGKTPLRVRSGACGGLDVILPNGHYVNCPISEPFVADSLYELQLDATDSLRIEDTMSGESTQVDLLPTPAYYSAQRDDGTSLSRIGQLCSDRLGIGLTNRCRFWEKASERCKFCSIGLNTVSGHENRYKTLPEILEVTEAAYNDPLVPARHVMLGGGTPEGGDEGTVAIAAAAAAIKERWPDRSVYAMVVPPKDRGFIDLLHESGVDELGMNVELFDPAAAARYTPGKYNEIGLDGYLDALEYAVGIFGPINTRSITVVGLEPAQSTIDGVRLLASIGVMPILSPFRPMAGTEMEHHDRASADELWQITLEATDAANQHGVPLGPTCIPCQANTLTMAGHPEYRFY